MKKAEKYQVFKKFGLKKFRKIARGSARLMESVDSELNFDEQRKLRIGKANKMVGAVRRSFQFLNPYTFVKLYKSMIRCHMENAVSVCLFPYLQKDIDEVEAVQRRATKMLAATKGLEYEDRLRLLKLPTLVYRRHRGAFQHA